MKRASDQFNRLLFWHYTCTGQFAGTKHMVQYLIRLVNAPSVFEVG